MNQSMTIHDVMNATHVDLNLLVAFDAIARERNVTRAAERAGVTQSAMSHALRRLREHIGDPLLVRSARGMTLTPRGEALVVPIRAALVAVARALEAPASFEPRTARRAFTLSSPDLFDVLVLPAVLEELQRKAPGIDLNVVPLGVGSLAEKLETGDLDLAVVPRVEGGASPMAVLTSELRRSTLFHDRFVCLLRAGHPALGKRKRALSLDAFVALAHVLVSPLGRGDSFVDAMIAKHGARRRVALRVPQFMTALEIVQRSDLVLTAPSALARLARTPKAVVALEPPIALPRHGVDLVWHERYSADAGHRWLRETVGSVAREVVSGDRD